MTASSLVEQCLEQSAVRVEAGRVQNRIFHRQVGAQALLQFAMHGLRAADEAHRGHPIAVAGQGIVRGLQHLGMVGKPQVVVGAEIDHLAAIGEPHDRTLRRTDDTFALQKSRCIERRRISGQPFAIFLQHGVVKFKMDLAWRYYTGFAAAAKDYGERHICASTNGCGRLVFTKHAAWPPPRSTAAKFI